MLTRGDLRLWVRFLHTCHGRHLLLTLQMLLGLMILTLAAGSTTPFALLLQQILHSICVNLFLLHLLLLLLLLQLEPVLVSSGLLLTCDTTLALRGPRRSLTYAEVALLL